MLSLVFLSSLCVWILANIGIDLRPVGEERESFLQLLATVIMPLLKPLGIHDWRLAAALLSGCFAKETIVSTLAVLTGAQGEELTTCLSAILPVNSARGFLVLVLFAPPCLTATVTLFREGGRAGRRQLLTSLLCQMVIGWCVAYVVFRLGSLMSG